MNDSAGLHTHAFWFYGVIVGLAIEEALKAVVPHILSPPSNQSPNLVILDVFRLIIFLVLIIRFYFGSVVFFSSGYSNQDSDTKYPVKNYALDFFFGFVHFIFFFVLAITIDAHVYRFAFLIILAIILSYDVLWFYSSKPYDTRKIMKVWMVINLVTLLISGLLYLIFDRIEATHNYVEAIAFIPILLASFIDIIELVRKKTIFKDWIASLIKD